MNENQIKNIERDLRARVGGADYVTISIIAEVFGMSKNSHRVLREKLADATQAGFGKNVRYRISDVARLMSHGRAS